MGLEWTEVAWATIPKGAQGLCPDKSFVADTPIGKVYVLGSPGSEFDGWYVYGPSDWWKTPVHKYLRSFRTTEKAFETIERETRAVPAGGGA